MGGIVNAHDAVEFLLAGARAVQIGTVSFNDPAAAVKVLDGLREFCREERVADVNELVGALKVSE